jgi:hypothetical protein
MTKISPPHEPVVRKLAHEISERAANLNRALAAGGVTPLVALQEVMKIEADTARLGRHMRALFDAARTMKTAG